MKTMKTKQDYDFFIVISISLYHTQQHLSITILHTFNSNLNSLSIFISFYSYYPIYLYPIIYSVILHSTTFSFYIPILYFIHQLFNSYNLNIKTIYISSGGLNFNETINLSILFHIKFPTHQPANSYFEFILLKPLTRLNCPLCLFSHYSFYLLSFISVSYLLSIVSCSTRMVSCDLTRVYSFPCSLLRQNEL